MHRYSFYIYRDVKVWLDLKAPSFLDGASFTNNPIIFPLISNSELGLQYQSENVFKAYQDSNKIVHLQ